MIPTTGSSCLLIYFPQLGEFQILQSLIAKLGWTHFQKIIYLDDPLKRDFYAEMCRLENWNTRTLHQKIQSMLFERTAISKKPDQLIRQELRQLERKLHDAVKLARARLESPQEESCRERNRPS